MNPRVLLNFKNWTGKIWFSSNYGHRLHNNSAYKLDDSPQVYASGGDPDSVAGKFGQHSLYKMLGYFSLIGLLRLHSQLGDYYQAIKVLENIEIHKKVTRPYQTKTKKSVAVVTVTAIAILRLRLTCVIIFSILMFRPVRYQHLTMLGLPTWWWEDTQTLLEPSAQSSCTSNVPSSFSKLRLTRMIRYINNLHLVASRHS